MWVWHIAAGQTKDLRAPYAELLDQSVTIPSAAVTQLCEAAGPMHEQQGMLLAEVDPQRIENIRRGWPFLRDRRIDAYSDITKRYIDGPSQ